MNLALDEVTSLRKLDVFAQLETRPLERIATIAKLVCVPKGEIAIAERQPADEFVGVVEGRMSISMSAPGKQALAVSSISAGEVLGWSALLPQKSWPATVQAVKNTTLVILPGSQLLTLCQEDHELGYEVMLHTLEAVAHRLQDTWLQLLDLYSQ